MRKWRFFFILIVILSALSYWKAIDYNFWRDDWTALWLWKFQRHSYFAEWTFPSRHPGEFFNLFPLAFIFNTNHFLWQGFGLLLKIIAALSIGLATYGFAQSRKTAAISGILYASYFGGLEAFTWLSARLSADLIILFCICIYCYTSSFKLNKKWLLVSSLIFLGFSTFIEPTRTLFFVPILLFWELIERYVDNKLFIKELAVRFGGVVISFLLPLFLTPVGRSLFSSETSGGYTHALLKDQHTLINFFTSISNLFLVYMNYIFYSQDLQNLIFHYVWLISIIILLGLGLWGFFLVLHRKKEGAFLFLSVLWIPCLYIPSWLAEVTLSVDVYNRYLALSAVGVIFIFSYFLNKINNYSSIILVSMLIFINVYLSITKIDTDYKLRSYQLTQKLYAQQEKEVPENFSGGLFWVQGDNGLRGSAFDWSLSGTIPFALTRGLDRKELLPASGLDFQEVMQLVCKSNINRPTITTWILQKQSIPLSKIYAWEVTEKGTLVNISIPFREKLKNTAPCFTSKNKQS